MALILWLLACGGGKEASDTATPTRPTSTPSGTTASGSTPTGTPPTTPTGTLPTEPTSAEVTSAMCAPQADNALRLDCEVSTDPPGAVVLELVPEGADPLRFDGTSGARITAWGGVPGVSNTWRAWPAGAPEAAVEGEWLPTPADLVDFDTTITRAGTPALDGVLTQIGCSTGERLAVIDIAGRVRWVEDPNRVRPDTVRVRGYEVTEDGTVLAVYDNDAIVEQTWGGDVLLDLRRGDANDRPLHHDVTRRRGYTIALDARQEDFEGLGPVVWDGFTVYDGAGIEVAAWDSRGALDPRYGNPCCGDYWYADFPGAHDFAHTNAIAADDDLNVYLSYRYIDTVQKVVGDPAAPDFGRVMWTLVGDPESAVPSDFRIVDPVAADPRFGSPHHVRPLAGGVGVGVYDNGWLRGEPTRIVELALDGDTATVTTSVDLGLRCPIQGSAFPLSDGQYLTVCSGDGAIFTIDPVTAERTWELVLTCPDGFVPRDPYRAIPVQLPR